MMYWKFIVGAVVALGIGGMLHALDIDRIEKKQEKALADLRAQLITECNTEKDKAYETQQSLQDAYNAIDAKLKRVRPAKCIMPTKGEASAQTGGDGYARGNGISSQWLREYAAECEQYRQERIALEANQ